MDEWNMLFSRTRPYACRLLCNVHPISFWTCWWWYIHTYCGRSGYNAFYYFMICWLKIHFRRPISNRVSKDVHVGSSWNQQLQTSWTGSIFSLPVNILHTSIESSLVCLFSNVVNNWRIAQRVDSNGKIGN